MRRILAAALAVSLLACGGGSKAPAAPAATPAPTPTPVPTFSGTYSGPVLLNVAGLAEVRGTGRTTVTHEGNVLILGSLTLTVPTLGSTVTYGLGRTTITGNTFAGTDSYQSSGCGTINTNMSGYFIGNAMNLTTKFTSSGRGSGCDPSEVRGELTRSSTTSLAVDRQGGGGPMAPKP
jgi:hypothetical protein